jgi:hypothetical protein
MFIYAKYVVASGIHYGWGLAVLLPKQTVLGCLCRVPVEPPPNVAGFKKRHDKQNRRSEWMMQLLRPVKLSHGIWCSPVYPYSSLMRMCDTWANIETEIVYPAAMRVLRVKNRDSLWAFLLSLWNVMVLRLT